MFITLPVVVKCTRSLYSTQLISSGLLKQMKDNFYMLFSHHKI